MSSRLTPEQLRAAAHVRAALEPAEPAGPAPVIDTMFRRFAAALVNRLLTDADAAFRCCEEMLGPLLPPPVLIGGYAGADAESDAAAAAQFAADWVAGSGSGKPGPHRAQAAQWFRSRARVIPAVAILAAQAGWDRQCWQIAARCHDPIVAEGALAESVSLSAAGLAAAERCPDAHAVALMHLACGISAKMVGRHDDALAHYDKALPIFQAMDDERGQAKTTLGAGAVHQVRRELHQARQCQLAVLDMTGIPVLTALATGNLGRIALDNGELAEAIRCSTAALRIIDGAGITALRQVIEVNHDLAEAHLIHGDLPAARRHANAALAAAETAAQQDMTFTYVHVAANLTAGRVALADGQLAQAQRRFTKGLEMRSHGNAHLLADLLEGLGQVFAAQGQLPVAQGILHTALAQRRIDGVAYLTASTTAHLADAYQNQNDVLAAALRAEAVDQLRPLSDAPSAILRERLAAAA